MSKPKYNKLELGTFILGIAVLAVLITYLIFQIVQKEEAPPNLKVSHTYQPQMENYAFKVTTENSGEETAEDVRLKLTLYQDGKEAETGEVSFSFVPVKSKKTAYIVFNKNRKTNDSLIISSRTYSTPF